MEAHGNGSETSVEVELRGLSIFTHHGVTEAEREVGQRLEFDVSFDVPDYPGHASPVLPPSWLEPLREAAAAPAA